MKQELEDGEIGSLRKNKYLTNLDTRHGALYKC